ESNMKVAVIYNKKGAEESDVINIFGPQTKEKYNPKTVELVVSALEKGGHNVKKIEGNINVADALYEFMPRVMAGERPGMVFNMAYGIQGQSRYTHIPAILEMLGVPYVGSGPQAHAVALDKVLTKILFQQHELPTPTFKVFSNPDEKIGVIDYPVIVKPKMEAVSMGMRIVDNEQDLRDAVKFVIDTYEQQALAESFVSGREFAVGLLGNGAGQEILPIVEFDFKGDPDAIQSHDNKMQQPVEKVCPAQLSADETFDLKRLAQEAFYALGINDFCRVDFRMDQNGNPYLLELNSMASLGQTGSYVKSASVAGYDFDALINRMLDVASTRYFGMAYPQVDEDAGTTKKTQPMQVRLRSFLRGHQVTMEDTLKKMVEINSHVHNVEGVNDLGLFIYGRLGQMGFKKKVYPQVEIGSNLYFTNHDDACNDVLLWDHLDNRSTYEDFVYFHGERGRFYGSGVAENKGGLAVMLGALRALRYTKNLRKIKCGILLTSDYSIGGNQSKKLVHDISENSKLVLGLKWGEAHGGVVTSCSGRAGFQVELSNVKTQIHSKSSDVISHLSRKIIALQKLTSDEMNIAITPLSMQAQTTIGNNPDYARLVLSLQFSNTEYGEELVKKMRDILRKNLGTNFKIRINQQYYRPPLEKSDLLEDVYKGISNIAELLEIRVKPFHREISSEISYVPKDIPAFDGLGPLGGSTRSQNEYIVQDSLLDRSLLLAMIIFKCGKGVLYDHT
ncbi:M20/M25/M40 family metallo-hydrolase, partial [Candidatus Latescibacterota bacterium]